MNAPVRHTPGAGAPETLAKPAYGSPCNNCGQCCQHVLCPLAQVLFEYSRGPCPAHEVGPEGYGCGLVRNPQRYRPTRTKIRGRTAMSQAALTLIGSGIGCDAHEVGEPQNPAFQERMRAAADRVRRDARRAKIVWGIGATAMGERKRRAAAGYVPAPRLTERERKELAIPAALVAANYREEVARRPAREAAPVPLFAAE